MSFLTRHLLLLPALCCVVAAFANEGRAAVITATIVSTTQADFDTLTDVDTSNSTTGALQSRVSQNQSFTQSNSDYTLDLADFLLTSRNVVTAEKTQPRQRGGDHFGASRLYLEFEIDSAMEFSLAGNWGFDGASFSAGPSLLEYSLTDANGTIFSASTTSNSGVGSSAFSESGVIQAGSYRLAFDAELSETYNSDGSASAGYTIDGFRLSAVTAVPEVSSFGLLAFSSFLVWIRRRRR